MTEELRPALSWKDALLYISKLEAEKAELVEALGWVLNTLPYPLAWKNEDMKRINDATLVFNKHEGEETK